MGKCSKCSRSSDRMIDDTVRVFEPMQQNVHESNGKRGKEPKEEKEYWELVCFNACPSVGLRM